jgi:uncharacterized membrane protein
MRRLLIVPVLLVMALAALPAAGTKAQDARCFPETGFCISGPIRQYWERNGGLPVFGFPITALQNETVEGWTGPVQWFERDRLEDHTNEGKGVLAGRLGVEYLARQGRPWQFQPLGGQAQGCRGFAETGYYLCGGFLSYWERNGGLERFGFPITNQITENIGGRDYTVQYFERRRMEFHPENRPPFDILLGLLGSELRRNPTPPPTPTPVPVSQQIRIDEPAENGIISSPVRVSGRTTLQPASGNLSYRVLEPNGVELASGTIPVTRQTSGEGSFSSYIGFRAPAGNTVVFELTERDQRTGAAIAQARRTARYQPTTAQQITIDRPASGTRVGTRIQVSGRTTLFPSEGDLVLNMLDGRGNVIISFVFGASGAPGQAATFFTEFDIPDQRGALVTIEVLDVNARGDVIARAQSNVFAGTSPYPVP